MTWLVPQSLNKKQYISLSHSSHSLSPSPSLSPSLSLTSPLSHPNPRLQIPHPKSISRPWELQIRVEDHLLHVFLPGEPCIGFQVLRGEKAHPRYIKFVSARSLFLGWFEWFSLVNLLEICPRGNHIFLYSWLTKCSLNIHGWQLVLINAYVKYLWNSLLVWIF